MASKASPERGTPSRWPSWSAAGAQCTHRDAERRRPAPARRLAAGDRAARQHRAHDLLDHAPLPIDEAWLARHARRRRRRPRRTTRAAWRGRTSCGSASPARSGIAEASQGAGRCDLCLVVGTSSLVYPGGGAAAWSRSRPGPGSSRSIRSARRTRDASRRGSRERQPASCPPW
jgi:hypothetical protein